MSGCGLCPACRWGVAKWVLDLKEINILARLQDEIDLASIVPKKISSTYGSLYSQQPQPGLCNECQDGCVYRVEVAKFMQDEIQKVPSFRSFL